jgi:uncharacterized membrane protein YeaQ/YmgE (transglycosylase-associated protein family)
MGFFDYLWLAVIGLVIGVVAKLLTPGRDPGGCIVTMLVGLVGSALGAAIGHAFGVTASSGLAWFLMSVLGAVILLFIYRLVIGSRKRP